MNRIKLGYIEDFIRIITAFNQNYKSEKGMRDVTDSVKEDYLLEYKEAKSE